MKRSLHRNTRGATAIEYGLIAALIAIAASSAMATVGTHTTKVFKTATKTIRKANKQS